MSCVMCVSAIVDLEYWSKTGLPLAPSCPVSWTLMRLLGEPKLTSRVQVQEEELSAEEAKERKIMKMLLKVKNGTPPQRKSALRQLTDKARELGAGPLFNQILPLLMAPTLEDQERHLLVKVPFLLPIPAWTSKLTQHWFLQYFQDMALTA